MAKTVANDRPASSRLSRLGVTVVLAHATSGHFFTRK